MWRGEKEEAALKRCAGSDRGAVRAPGEGREGSSSPTFILGTSPEFVSIGLRNGRFSRPSGLL